MWCTGWAWGWMWVWPLLVLVGVVLLLVGGVVWLARRPGQSGQLDPARRILDERFARGEIDEDDYRRRRDTLR
jgi:putative membrane protein